MTTMFLTIGEETAADTDTQADDDKVLHTVGTSESILSQGRDMRIVRQANSQSDTVAQHSRQWHDAFPRQVSRILDTSGNRAGTGTADTYGTDGLVTTILLNHHHDFLTQCRHEVIHIRIIFRRESVFSEDIASDIYHGIGSTLNADIHTDNRSFDIIFLHYYDLLFKQ